MKLIGTISSDVKQNHKILLDSGYRIDLTLEYKSNQKGWFFDLTYLNFSLYGRRIINGVNLLRQFREVIPFGLSCLVNDGYEPVLINDFSSGRAKLYLLDAADIQEVEEIIRG